MSPAIAAYVTNDRFDPALMASAVGTTAADIAFTAGLGKDSVQRKDRVGTPKVQRRLRELSELVARVAPSYGSEMMAYAWLRSHALPGFGGLTAMDLLQQGHADWVHESLSAAEAGIYQ